MTQIEEILRRAPHPPPPPGLKRRLIEEMHLNSATKPGRTTPPAFRSRGWFARWWPILLPATASLACAMVLTLRHTETGLLRNSVNLLSKSAEADQTASRAVGAAARKEAPADSASGVLTEREETAKLKQAVQRLKTEISQLEKLAAENKQLQAQLAIGVPGISPEMAKALEDARARAQSIACINNLRQLGLAVKEWEIDHGHAAPTDLLLMTNEMSTPKLLYCPADTSRQAATDWRSYSSANCSYQYVGAGAPDNEPTRVLFICPIHGSVLLNDGSVQQGVAKNHPEDLVRIDGHLYLQQ